MTELKDSFCSSPWFHIRINPAGYYQLCRWISEWRPEDGVSEYHVRDYSIKQFMNSMPMREFRMNHLLGMKPKQCAGCYYEDDQGKLSGRNKQLLKSAIKVSEFTKSLCTSPHWQHFEYSLKNQGKTDRLPTDIQIDLGNTCNSACIMCNPTYSSRLASDYKKLTALEPTIFPQYQEVKNWADDPVLLDKFIDDLLEIPGIKYLHFLGGETLYLESFYTICDRLIERGLSQDIIIGTTTNGTIYTDRLLDLINKFKEFHLGFSIETLDSLNDYVRYPSRIDDIKTNLTRFLDLRNQSQNKLQLTLRITPNIFTISRIHHLFDYMIRNKLIAESCNILSDPSCLRIELLPEDIKQQIQKNIDMVIKYHNISISQLVINRRRTDLALDVIENLIYEYKTLLENITAPPDVEQQRSDLVKFVKSFESIRKNTILDSLPEYEEFLRRYGY